MADKDNSTPEPADNPTALLLLLRMLQTISDITDNDIRQDAAIKCLLLDDQTFSYLENQIFH